MVCRRHSRNNVKRSVQSVAETINLQVSARRFICRLFTVLAEEVCCISHNRGSSSTQISHIRALDT